MWRNFRTLALMSAGLAMSSAHGHEPAATAVSFGARQGGGTIAPDPWVRAPRARPDSGAWTSHHTAGTRQRRRRRDERRGCR